LLSERQNPGGESSMQKDETALLPTEKKRGRREMEGRYRSSTGGKYYQNIQENSKREKVPNASWKNANPSAEGNNENKTRKTTR